MTFFLMYLLVFKLKYKSQLLMFFYSILLSSCSQITVNDQADVQGLSNSAMPENAPSETGLLSDQINKKLLKESEERLKNTKPIEEMKFPVFRM